jgi:hypothetical protein
MTKTPAEAVETYACHSHSIMSVLGDRQGDSQRRRRRRPMPPRWMFPPPRTHNDDDDDDDDRQDRPNNNLKSDPSNNLKPTTTDNKKQSIDMIPMIAANARRHNQSPRQYDEEIYNEQNDDQQYDRQQLEILATPPRLFRTTTDNNNLKSNPFDNLKKPNCDVDEEMIDAYQVITPKKKRRKRKKKKKPIPTPYVYLHDQITNLQDDQTLIHDNTSSNKFNPTCHTATTRKTRRKPRRRLKDDDLQPPLDEPTITTDNKTNRRISETRS